jgi:hypothetical protein
MNNSDNGDYTNKNTIASSITRGLRYSWKQARRAKDTENNNIKALLIYFFDTSSKEIPIYGYFILKIIKLEIVYCLIFSQILLLYSGEQE